MITARRDNDADVDASASGAGEFVDCAVIGKVGVLDIYVLFCTKNIGNPSSIIIRPITIKNTGLKIITSIKAVILPSILFFFLKRFYRFNYSMARRDG